MTDIDRTGSHTAERVVNRHKTSVVGKLNLKGSRLDGVRGHRGSTNIIEKDAAVACSRFQGEPKATPVNGWRGGCRPAGEPVAKPFALG